MSKGGIRVTEYDDPNVRIYHGQMFRRVAEREHVREDGTLTWLTTWCGKCLECGASFECKSPTLSPTFSPNRRCSRHRKPGVKVGREADV